MRLLEFNEAVSGTGPQQATLVAVQIKDLHDHHATRVHPPGKPANRGQSGARVFPIKSNTVHTPAQRGPIDIEQLQQRVATLEKRIRQRTTRSSATDTGDELEQLRQRLLKLERNINSELWAARQREYTMLEMLAKQPLAERIGQRLTRFRSNDLPATGRWLREAALEWFQDRQPDWWPTFARAWQESLDSARGIPKQ